MWGGRASGAREWRSVPNSEVLLLRKDPLLLYGVAEMFVLQVPGGRNDVATWSKNLRGVSFAFLLLRACS